MATQTIDLNGTTDTVANENAATLDVIGPGTLDITGNANGADITTDSAVIEINKNFNTGTVHFGTGVSTVDVTSNLNSAVFQNLNAGDRIELGKFTFNGGSYDTITHMLTLTENGSAVTTLDLTLASGAPATFNFGSDSATGFDFFQVACFAAGTRILTDRGEIAVEELCAGDLAVTLSGNGASFKPVRWIGERRVDIAGHNRPDLVRPVRIRAGAFGTGMPHRDLVVSSDHSLFIDGVLISAAKLVNGVSIVQDLTARSVHYFHVELDHHDILLADGIPAESYLDTGNRDQFANGERVVTLHPNFQPKRMQTDACKPFVEDGPVLAEVRRRLIERVAAEGYVVSHEPELHLMVNGRPVHASAVKGMVYRFELPAEVREVRIVSRSGVPSGTVAGQEDARRLGICLAGLALTAMGGITQEIALTDLACEGVYWLESNGEVAWRWTNGDARLTDALPDGIAGGATLELRLLWPGMYWIAPDAAERVLSA